MTNTGGEIMKKKTSLHLGLLLLIISSLVSPSMGSGITINIDGDFSDWNGITPIFEEEDIHPEYWIDIQKGFVAANDTTLFIRLDYAAPLDYWKSLMGNITIRTPSNEIYILMYQIVYETYPFWSFSAIFPGRNLTSFLNNKTNPEYVDYQNSVAIDISTNRTVEYYFLLADLGLQLTDSIDIAFWHYENESAGQYSILLHRFAGIAYQVSLNPTVETDIPQSSTTLTTTETLNPTEGDSTSPTTSPDITSIDTVGVVLAIGAVFLFYRRRRSRI